MKNSGSSGVLYLVVGGLIFSAGIFLILFITSPRAATPPPHIRNLRIPPLPTPPRPKMPPLTGQATVILASPIGIPQTSPSNSTASAEVNESVPSPESTASSEILSE